MSILSKLFEEVFKNKSCQYLAHPWTPSCMQANIQMIVKSLPSTLRVALLNVMLPFISKAQFDWETVLKSLITVGKFMFVCIGSFTGMFALSCIFHQLFGKYYFLFVYFVPTWIVANIVVILPDRERRILMQFILSMALQSVIMASRNTVIKFLRRSKSIGNLLFMTLSSIIMHNLRKNKCKLFWFLKPSLPPKFDATNAEINSSAAPPLKSPFMDMLRPTSQCCCLHAGNCDDHIRVGIVTFIKYGALFEIIKATTFSISKVKEPWEFLKVVYSNCDHKFLTLLTAYVGIYRFSNCLLNRHLGRDSELSNIISGFLCGYAFTYSPNYNLFILGISTAIQLVWSNYQIESENKPAILVKINKLPLSLFTYIISISILVHYRLLYPHKMARAGVQYLDMLSAGRISIVSRQVLAALKE